MEALPDRIVTLEERPELAQQVAQLDRAAWPEFMYHSRAWRECWESLQADFHDYQIILTNGDGSPAAVGHTIPASWDGSRDEMPAGWDFLLEQSTNSGKHSQRFNILAGLMVIVAPGLQGQGLSSRILAAMKDLAVKQGLSYVLVPVRPTLKSAYPLTPLERYIHWKRPDGTHLDPWLRTHLRVGGQIIGVAAESKVISGTTAEWTEWAQMAFPESGAYIVPGALEPVSINCDTDMGRYVEGNVWVLHEVE